MRLYERDLPGEFSLKDNFIKDAFKSFEGILEKDYPELKSYFKSVDYNHKESFYEEALDYYFNNESAITYGNIDVYADNFVSNIKQSFIRRLARDKQDDDNQRTAIKTGKVNGKKVWHWEKDVDPDDGTYKLIKVDGVDGNFNYDGVYESMNITEAKQILNEKGYILEKVLPKYKQFRLHCEERFKEISDQVKEILIKEYNLNPNQFQTDISGSFCTISIKWRFIIVNLSIEENGKKLYITNYITERQKVFDIKMLDSEDIPRIVLDTITQSRLSDLLNR